MVSVVRICGLHFWVSHWSLFVAPGRGGKCSLLYVVGMVDFV